MAIGAKPVSEQDDNFSLGSLAEGGELHGDIELSGDLSRLVEALERMVVIRLVEERIGKGVEDGIIKCPCHLAIGQEAPAVGVAMHLRPTDRGFGAHRSHSHFLAAGGSLRGIFAEVLGRETGASRGMGGSMHLIARENGFYGSVPIVGATIPIAVGAGLAAKMDAKGDIAVSYFGDGATEEGVFHESMNLAAILRVPVLFVCENNMFSSHLHIDLRQPANSLVRYAAAHCVPFARVDGNDVVEIARVAGDAIATMRQTGGPFFLECVTYRWRGHVGHREDEDVGVQRKDDLAIWKGRDPIARLARSLEAAGLIEKGHLESVRADVGRRIESAWKQASGDPFPPKEALLGRTWTPGSD
jgi:TPP-dependent pyruvate/acetoin dehydrogenase alpha subunit